MSGVKVIDGNNAGWATIKLDTTTQLVLPDDGATGRVIINVRFQNGLADEISAVKWNGTESLTKVYEGDAGAANYYVHAIKDPTPTTANVAVTASTFRNGNEISIAISGVSDSIANMIANMIVLNADGPVHYIPARASGAVLASALVIGGVWNDGSYGDPAIYGRHWVVGEINRTAEQRGSVNANDALIWAGIRHMTDYAQGFSPVLGSRVSGTHFAITIPLNNDAAVATTVTVTPATAEIVTAGGTQQLTPATVDQYGLAFSTTYTWASDNEAVATVDANGLVTAVGNGTCTITCTEDTQSITDTSAITVTLPPVSGRPRRIAALF